MRRFARLKWTVSALLICTGALLFAPGCGEHKQGADKPQDVVIGPADFVGNAACEECHKQEFQLHKGSRHDRTLHLASTNEELGELAPPLGRIMNSKTSVVRAGDTFAFEVHGKRSNPIRL